MGLRKKAAAAYSSVVGFDCMPDELGLSAFSSIAGQQLHSAVGGAGCVIFMFFPIGRWRKSDSNFRHRARLYFFELDGKKLSRSWMPVSATVSPNLVIASTTTFVFATGTFSFFS